MFYFPIWGLMAAYLSDRLAATQPLQVVSLSLVDHGLASTGANAVCGVILQASGNFALVHGWVAAWLLPSLWLLQVMSKGSHGRLGNVETA